MAHGQDDLTPSSTAQGSESARISRAFRRRRPTRDTRGVSDAGSTESASTRSTTGHRRSADERRQAIVEAALTEFAAHGFKGATVEAMAREVGISQPYVFRLFQTKLTLFVAVID
jgi:AcrR family transcriptional regulator